LWGGQTSTWGLSKKVVRKEGKRKTNSRIPGDRELEIPEKEGMRTINNRKIFKNEKARGGTGEKRKPELTVREEHEETRQPSKRLPLGDGKGPSGARNTKKKKKKKKKKKPP